MNCENRDGFFLSPPASAAAKFLKLLVILACLAMTDSGAPRLMAFAVVE
jgi:hypothetical protein